MVLGHPLFDVGGAADVVGAVVASQDIDKGRHAAWFQAPADHRPIKMSNIS
jgi:hypothetical protein